MAASALAGQAIPTKPAKFGKQCCVINCSNYGYRDRCSLHRFPKDKKRAEKWRQNCRNQTLMAINADQLHKTYRVCSNHFEACCFINKAKPSAGLKPDAVPTIVECPNPPARIVGKRKAPRSRSGDEPPTKLQKQGTDDDENPEIDVLSMRLKNTQKRLEREVNKVKKLRVQVSRLKKKQNCQSRLKSGSAKSKVYALRCIKPYLTEKAFKFVSTQVRVSGKKVRGGRFTLQDKALCMSVFSISPKVYRHLRSIFILPSRSTLRRTLQKVDFEPGFQGDILKALKKMTEKWKEDDKMCVLLMDEMSIQERIYYSQNEDRVKGFEDLGNNTINPVVANHALVFMVRGLTKKWKQPIGYFITSGTVKADRLKTLILQAVQHIRESGLNCVATVCDQGSNNLSVLKKLGVSQQQTSFTVGNDERPIFVFYDTPHVIKNTRNNMKKSGFIWKGALVSWKIIQDVYYYDKSRHIRMLPNLTEKHVTLEGFGTNMRVCYATQILSHKVAAAIETMVAITEPDPVYTKLALHTAKFCDTFNTLFDIFNSKGLFGKYPLARALKDGSPHWEFLRECQEWLPDVRSPGAETRSRQLPCIEAWQVNITSLKQLWDHINLQFMITNRLNQDALENFFSRVRGKNAQNDRPDSRLFAQAYRDITMEHFFTLSSKTNCEEDVDSFLVGMEHVGSLNEGDLHEDHAYASSGVPSTSSPNVEAPEMAVGTLGVPNSVFSLLGVCTSTVTLDIQDANVATYIAGYLCKKMLSYVNNCHDCKTLITCIPDEGDTKYLFLEKRQYAGIKVGLHVPSSDFVEQVELMEKAFRIQAPLLINHDKVSKGLYTFIRNEVDVTTMSCANKICASYIPKILKLYINLRLHHLLKTENERIRRPNQKRNRKFLKVSHF